MSFEDRLHASIQRRVEEKRRRRPPLKAPSADNGGQSHSLESPYRRPLPETTSIDSITKPTRTMTSHDFRQRAEKKLAFALENSYTNKTKQNYNYAAKRLVKFAADCGIPEAEALPCNPRLLCLFIASGIGHTGTGTATANVAAIADWHKRQGLPFETPTQMQTIKRAIKLHWPKEKQQKHQRPPVTPGMMRSLTAAWRTGNAREKGALAMALCAWIGQMRLGELMPTCIDEIIPSRLPSRKEWIMNEKLGKASAIHLPWTKTNLHKGDTVVLPTQQAPLDATQAICHHILASRLDDTALLCQYKDGDTIKTFDKSLLMNMCNEIWQKEGIQRITGHSFRIGGTTAYLMAGVDPDIVKKMGRWSSDAFLRYWRSVNGIFEAHASSVEFVEFTL
jgi:hypothetical protein